MHQRSNVVGQIVGVHLFVGIFLEVVFFSGYDIAINDLNVLVSVRSWLFVNETKRVSKFVGNTTSLK